MSSQTGLIGNIFSSSEIVWLCLLVSCIGVVVVIAIVWFGRHIFAKSQYDFWRLADFVEFWNKSSIRPNIPRYFLDALTESLHRRNEFWMTYGQVIISTFIIVILAILLLTKSISAEAGLPLLSAVSGFAIAKGVNTSSRAETPGPDREQGPSK